MNELEQMFIGREQELEAVQKMVFDPSGACHFWPIIGPGGVGKTWLLRECFRRYAQDERVVVVRIDYAETRFQNPSALYLHVLEQFNAYFSYEQQDMYRKKLSEWERFAGLGFDPERVQRWEQEVYQHGNDLVNRVCEQQQKRLLFLHDTVEMFRMAAASANQISAFFAGFANAVLIVAGRPESELFVRAEETLPLLYQGWTVHPPHEVRPFSAEETARYLEASLPAEVPGEVREKITLLTGGNPVLVAIAGEWLRRHVDLPEDIDLPLGDLQKLGPGELATRRRRFEFELVDKVRSLGEDIDWAVLYLAYLDRRYDPRILRLVLDIEEGDEIRLNAIIKNLRTLVFVRKSMTAEGGLLHDESRRLFQQHAWPVVDPDGTIRRELARKIIDGYYLPEIERLGKVVQEKVSRDVGQKAATPERSKVQLIPGEEWLRRELLVECLDYHLRVSNNDGRQYFEHLFEEALERRSIPLLDLLIQAVHTLASDWVRTPWFQVRQAQVKLERGERPEARSLAQTVLDTPDLTIRQGEDDIFIRALDVLSGSTSDPSEKIALLEQARERAESAHITPWLVRIHSYLGLSYRQQGRWIEAERSYQEALRLLDEQQDPIRYANTLNNLAFVRMLRGDLEGADNVADRALKIRKREGHVYGLALSYSTKGRIAEEKGIYAEARRCYRTSVELFNSLEKHDDAALRKISLSAGVRSERNFEESHRLLADGLVSTREDIRAVALYHQAKVFRAEARTLEEQDIAHEKIPALYQRAREIGLAALQQSRHIQDAYLEARILLDLAVNTLFHEQREDRECIEALEEILKEYQFLREKGRLVELKGDLAYTRQEFVTAFEHYLDACSILSEHSTVVFDQTFTRIRNKFLDASSEVQRRICQMIQEKVQLFTRNHDISSAEPHQYQYETALVAIKRLCDDTLEFC
jgi:tetratricopeptide (TPR) repeat protein